MDNRSEIREFLTSRRARITPQQAGLPVYGVNRRVSGLRREEVAMLAGVSVGYYTRLERGALGGVSESVLDALANALKLDDVERAHLFDLARTAGTSPGRSRRSSGTRGRTSWRRTIWAGRSTRHCSTERACARSTPPGSPSSTRWLGA